MKETIALTCEVLPRELTVIRFKSGHRLLVKVPLQLPARIHVLLFSMCVYLILGKLFSEVFGYAVGFGEIAEILASTVALLACLLTNRRGAFLTIFLDRPRYDFTSPTSVVKRKRYPRFDIATSAAEDGWMSILSLDGERVATRFSEVSMADAEKAFRTFAATFQPVGERTAQEGVNSGEQEMDTVVVRESPGPVKEVHRQKRLPLIVLVHGTWGRCSKWAIPEKSPLVKGLRDELGLGTFEVTRFAWTGANRPRARSDAVRDLATVLRDNLRVYDHCCPTKIRTGEDLKSSPVL